MTDDLDDLMSDIDAGKPQTDAARLHELFRRWCIAHSTRPTYLLLADWMDRYHRLHDVDLLEVWNA